METNREHSTSGISTNKLIELFRGPVEAASAVDILTSTGSTLTSHGIPQESTTMATMIGIIVVILVAIAILFALGLFIDCRHQKLVGEKIDSSGRKRSRDTRSIRRMLGLSKTAEPEVSNIAENAEAIDRSPPPAERSSDIV